MSGVDQGMSISGKVQADAMFAHIRGVWQYNISGLFEHVIARARALSSVVSKNGKALGVIYLKDIVKGAF